MLVVGTLAYAASYFARGWLAGHQRFGLFGGLVLMESVSRVCFALAVAIGIASGQTAVALGIAAAPFVSLVVVPVAFARDARRASARSSRSSGGGHEAALAAAITADEADAALAGPGTEGVQEAAAHDDLSLRRGGGFAVWVSGIMLSEQTLLNAAVLTVDATSPNRALAGIVFNVLLIARAPLQLFQAIQTSLLPHLTGLEATAGHDAFAQRDPHDRARDRRLRRRRSRWASCWSGRSRCGTSSSDRTTTTKALGLALIGVGMGLHLCSGALNQAALARDRARAAAGCWLLAAALFVGWMLHAGDLRTAAARRDRLRRRHGRCWRSRCALYRHGAGWLRLQPHARALRRRRPSRRSRGRPRRGPARRRSPSRRRTRSRPPAGRRAPCRARCRRRPRTATPSPTSARTRGSFSSECSMNGLPAPARVDGHAQRHVDLRRRPPRARRRACPG